jgi:hypothetical protein
VFYALVASLTLALLAPQPAAQAQAPSGWASLQDDRNDRFFFPQGADHSTFVAIFPSRPLDRTLEQTLSNVWHATIGTERLVDAQQKRTLSPDGAPALLELVATVDGANRGIYRVFMVKQYGPRIVSGEFRSDDPDKMKDVGDAAMRMLQGMTLAR